MADEWKQEQQRYNLRKELATQVAHLGFSVEQAVKSANDLEQMAFARARDFTSYIQTVSDTLSKVKENRWRNTREKFGADLVGCIQLVEQVPYAAIGLTREDVLTWSTSLAKMVEQLKAAAPPAGVAIPDFEQKAGTLIQRCKGIRAAVAERRSEDGDKHRRRAEWALRNVGTMLQGLRGACVWEHPTTALHIEAAYAAHGKAGEEAVPAPGVWGEAIEADSFVAALPRWAPEGT